MSFSEIVTHCLFGLRKTGVLVPAFLLMLSGCQQIGQSIGQQNKMPVIEYPGDEPEYGCSYFYFLWGRHAELDQRYEEAMEAYEKALICDPEAYFIMQKLPVLLLRMGKEEESISWLEKYLTINPQESGSRMLLAKILVRQSRFEEAARHYRLVYEQNPEDYSALLLLAEMYLSLNQFAEAEKLLHEVLKGDDHSYGAHVLLGQAYRSKHDFQKAQHHYQAALEDNWSAELVLELADLFMQQQQYEKALEMYNQVLEAEEDHEKARASKIHVLLLLKKNEQALEELNIMRDFSEYPSRVDLAMAKLYISMDQADKAIVILKEMLEVEYQAEAGFLLGLLYVNQEKYDLAQAELDRIPADSPSYREAVYLRVRVYKMQGKTAQAVATLEKALAGSHGVSVDMYLMLALLYQEQEQFDQSRKTFESGMVAFPEDSNLLYEFGLFNDNRKEYDKAMDVMKKVIQLDQDHAAALNYIGYTWADKGIHLEEALEYIKRAVDLKPDNGYIRDSLGWIYFRLGLHQQALEEIEKALEISGDDPSIFEHLGDIHHKIGNWDAAVQAYRKSLELFEDEEGKSRIENKIKELEQPEKEN